jgi:hypothetical protein
MIRKLKFFSDPGHGWLEVQKNDLEKLGIASKITDFSYQKNSKVYLEEDIDAQVYLEAAKGAGWEVGITESYIEKESWIRNLKAYEGI